MAFERSELKNDFGDPIGEARSCREDCALFDFSFLECVRLRGPDALSVVEAFVRRPLATLTQGAIAYAIRTDSYGTALADVTVWRTGPDTFEVMSGRREDVWALMASAPGQVEANDLGEARVVFAVQGLGSKLFFPAVSRRVYGANLLVTRGQRALSQWMRCGSRPGLSCSPTNSGCLYLRQS